MGRALTALLVLLAAAPAVGARDVLEVIDACTARLDAELDVGFEKIAAQCPELAPSLTRSPWSAWLPSDWDQAHNSLSVGGLRELRALIVAESERRVAASEPDVRHVAAVLATLAPAKQGPVGWWERFKAWLHEMLTARDSGPQRNWLGQLIEALGPHGPWLAISVAALVLVGLLAGTMVLSELREARLPGWQRAASLGGAPGEAGAGIASWDLIEAAAPTERPRLLLELIAARLAVQDRLPPARALTVQELLRAARLPDAADRARLAALAVACERLTFSGRGLSAQQLSTALERGRELLDGLVAVPT